jgi:anti-anti-sigma regulatory factor
VTLDLGRVERIDAAGISALLSLYVSAREAGRCFTVVNLSPHVAEILTLVGVKLVLTSHIVATNSQSGTRFKDSSQRKCL